MADSDYDIFREWKPDRPVQVGDVGFIRNGRFHSLFNVLRPAEEQSNVPEYYEPLCHKFSDHISNSSLGSSHYPSAGINVESEPDFHAFRREDTFAKGDFGAWIVKHIDRWFAFARGLGLEIKKMEEIILVTGCDRAASWTNVAFLGNNSEYNAQAKFGVNVDHDPAINIEWQSSSEHVQRAVLHQGPDGTNLPEDQCVFIRGFRVARTFSTLPKQPKATAGPSPGPDSSYDFEQGIEIGSIPATPKYRDPLCILLDYIAERAPDCDMFLIHDDDLKRINVIGDGTSPEDLQPGVVTDLLRRSDIEVHAVQCDLSHTSSDPKSNVEVVRVAMISSQNWSFAPQSQSSSLAAQRVGSTDLLHAIESPPLTPQILPSNLPVPTIQSETYLGRSDPVHSRLEHALKYLVDLFLCLSRKLRGTFAHVQPVSIVLFACTFAVTWSVYFGNVNIFALTLLLTINVLYMWIVRHIWRQNRGRLSVRRETPRHYVMSNLAVTVPAPVDDARNSLL